MKKLLDSDLMPCGLVLVLLTLFVSVAVMSAQGQQRYNRWNASVTEDVSSFVTEDVTHYSQTVTEEVTTEYPTIAPKSIGRKGFIPSAVEETREEEKTASLALLIPNERLKKIESRDAYVMDEWNEKLCQLLKTVETNNPDVVPEIVVRFTELTEADGALYYYVRGHVHDTFSRRSKIHRLSNYTKAVENYNKAIELEDSVALYYHFLGQVNYYYAWEENAPEFFEKAVPNYQKAEKLDPGWPMPVNAQGWCLFRQGRYSEALPYYERALDVDEKCQDALCGIIQTYVALSDKNPKDVSLVKKGLDYVRQSHLLIQSGDDSHGHNHVGCAMQLVSRLRELEPIMIETHPEYYSKMDCYFRGLDAYQQMKQYKKAIQFFDLAESSEQSIYFLDCMNSNFGFYNTDLLRFKAMSYYHLGEYAKAVEIFERFFTQSNDQQMNFVDVNSAYTHSLIKLGKYQTVFDFYQNNDFVKNQNNLYRGNDTFIYVALAMGKTGRTEEMLRFIEPYENLLFAKMNLPHEGLSEEITELLSIYLLEQCQKKTTPESIRKFLRLTDEWIKCDSDQYPRYKTAGELLTLQKDYQLAATYYEKYLAFVPNDENATYALLGCYESINNNEKSYQTATRLIAINPEMVDYWIERAVISENLSRISEMRSTQTQDLTKAIQLLEEENPDNEKLLRLYVWRADSYKKARQLLKAIHDYRKAVDLKGNSGMPETFVVDNIKENGKISVYQDLVELQFVSKDYLTLVNESSSFIEKGGDERFWVATRGKAYLELDEYEKAIEDFSIIINFPRSSVKGSMPPDEAYRLIGYSYLCLKNYDKAIDFLTEAIEISPRKVEFYHSRSTAYQRRADRQGISDEERDQDLKRANADRERANQLNNE